MAINLLTNPIVVAETGTVITKPTKVKLIQWVNLTTDEIADGDALSITVNGATIAISATATGVVHYEVYLEDFSVYSLILNTLGGGEVLVWLA